VKKAIALLVCMVAFTATSAFAAESIVGTWDVQQIEMYLDGKKVENPKAVDGYIEITSQDGPLFSGTKHWIRGGKKYSEALSGSITDDNEIIIQEHVDGEAEGSLLPGDMMVLFYTEGPPKPRVHKTILKRR
jgi:hypothetical protein